MPTEAAMKQEAPPKLTIFHFHLGDSTALSLAMEQGGSQELKLDMNPTGHGPHRLVR